MTCRIDWVVIGPGLILHISGHITGKDGVGQVDAVCQDLGTELQRELRLVHESDAHE